MGNGGTQPVPALPQPFFPLSGDQRCRQARLLHPPWPGKLPETAPDPTALSARFGRANKKREDQIAAILETLRGLGL